MNVSLDISLYPLSPEYKAPIIAFIDALRGYEGIEMHFNSLSTQLFGEWDLIWAALGKELPRAFGEAHTSVAVIKVVSLNVIE